MSLPLHRFFLTDPFTTPRGWAIVAPGTTAGATFYFHNQTDTSMDVYGDGSDSEYLGTIPAELGFFAIHPRKGYLSLEFRPGTVLNASSAPSAYVDGQYFAPGEADPGYPMIGLSRLVNVGNSVSVGTSDILQGTGQQAGITTQDRNSVPNHYPTLIPAQAAAGGGQTDIALAPLDTNGLPLISAALTVKATETDITTPLFISAPIIEVGAVPTAGALGVAAVIAAPGPFAVTTIGVKNPIIIAPPANGFYRMSVHVLLNNAVSGNALTVSASYRDANGTNRTSNMTLISGSTSVIAAGVTSMANGAWAGNSLSFYATTGANITLNYNDPTNTPNDTVNVILERLA